MTVGPAQGTQEPLQRFISPRRQMPALRFLVKMLLPLKWSKENDEGQEFARYRKIWWYVVGLTMLVSLTPLVVMTELNDFMYRGALQSETHHRITRALSNVSRSLEFVVEERVSALELLIEEHSLADLSSNNNLAAILSNLQQSFGGFVDLGVIDRNGVQGYYTGPYNLQGDHYDDQEWFQDVALHGVHVSDVFMGHRQLPHFVIAVRRDIEQQSSIVLRATVEMELLTNLVIIPELEPSDDVFIVNKDGILQTPTRHHGRLLEYCSIPIPSLRSEVQRIKSYRENGHDFVLGYRAIARTPFMLIVLKSSPIRSGPWQQTRTEVLSILVGGSFLIILVVLWLSTYMVRQIRSADLHREEMLHRMEFTAKMSTIGRLAASVAHEINNPLAIINERAGLLQDLVHQTENQPNRDKTLRCLESITKSVERCSNVTHRLLGFTRSVESSTEPVDPANLLQEVLGFTGKDPEHRNISIETRIAPGTPPILGDRGRLQQIFLNIVNNALAAVGDGGTIDLIIDSPRAGRVLVIVQDDGAGIPEDKLPYIFEPFFSMKGNFGTGLGLSITYDLVQKMGGRIDIRSEQGEGTTVSVELPASPDLRGET
jgi:two-component system NtrC family sensor kinase